MTKQTLSLLAAILAASTAHAASLDLSSIPSTAPADASGPLSTHVLGFSMETAFVQDFLGNKTQPNELVLKLIGNIADRSGAVGFRPGGITVDSSIYDPSLTTSAVLDQSATGGIYRTTYGPSFFESMNLLPDTTLVVMDLNLGNSSYEIALNEAKAAKEILGGKLESFEFGNEPDQYNSGQRDLANWGPVEYTAQFESWSTNLTSDLSLEKPFFQAGAFAKDPTYPAGPQNITTETIVKAGIASGGLVKTFSQHMYQYSTCDPARNALATLDALVNHTNIMTYVDQWKPQVAAAQGVNSTLVIGEFSSVSCSGKQNVSNTYGSALWLADTILYSASINITRMYAHQGATLVAQSSDQANSQGYSWYDFVYPKDSARNGPARASPNYPAWLLLGEFLKKDDAYNTYGTLSAHRLAYIATPQAPQLATYALYSPTALLRMVVLNFSPDNSTITLPNVGSSGAASVKRLSPAGGVASVVSEETLWAGQSWAQGTGEGTLVVESMERGQELRVGAWEGVLVDFAAANGTTSGNGNGTATGTGTSAGAQTTKASGAAREVGAGGWQVGAVALGLVLGAVGMW